MIAIVAQAMALNIAIQPVAEGINLPVMNWIKVSLLFLASVWMASNHRFEKDLKQRAKNIEIELAYCCVQADAALTAYYTQAYFWGAVILIVVACVYLLEINPRYMKRKLTK